MGFEEGMGGAGFAVGEDVDGEGHVVTQLIGSKCERELSRSGGR